MCPLDLVKPGGGFSPRSKILNATSTFDISNLMASYHKVFLSLFFDLFCMLYRCGDFNATLVR